MLLATSLALVVPFVSATAYAQGPIDDAGPSMAPFATNVPSAPDAAPASSAPAPSPMQAPAAPTSTSTSSERPVRGPAVRERSGRRSRAGSAASGALMLTMLIGIMGYYVVKRLRR
jgi:hypothetical protein